MFSGSSFRLESKGSVNSSNLSKTLLVFLIGIFSISLSKGTIFTVLNLNDSNLGSFRFAIGQANATPGLDTIRFALPGTISLLSPMTGITDAVFIDGSSAPGYTPCGPPTIILNGSGAGSANGLQFFAGASGSTLLAMNVQGFALNGIQFIDSDANTVQGCYVGLNAFGTAAAPNGLNGLQMEGGSDFNIIGGAVPCQGNAFSGNAGAGISVNFSNSNVFAGNLVGLSGTGTAAVGNGSFGINLVNGSNNNTIGGTLLTARNVISNNGTGLTGNGININGSSDNTVQNNFIGLNILGNVAMGNAENGLAINAAPGTIIGGTGPHDGNFIADHNFHAIVLNGGSNNCTIQGNVCGTDSAGVIAMGNDDSGVIVINSSNVQIGGTAAGAGNLFSGSISEYGIFVISSSSVIMEGNLIGTDITGTVGIPNFDGGIRIDFNSNDNTVGGSAAGAGNIIAFNTGYGVGILSNNCARNLVSRNSMFCNTDVMIDLNGVGNNNHPSPVINTLTAGGATGTANPLDVVELFYDDGCTAACQGRTFIGTASASAGGIWSYTGALNSSATLVAVGIRTAAPASFVNNTSEATCFTNPFPVEWAWFNAESIGDGSVQLDWATASENNASHFEIERSVDGDNFEKLGEVGAANSNQGSEYQYFDLAPVAGVNYYRLRQVDLNGQFDYSEVRTVRLDASAQMLQVAPNPTNGPIQFTWLSEETPALDLQLLNTSGQLVWSGTPALNAGERFTLPTYDLPAGIYFLKATSKTQTAVEKVIVR